MIESEQEAAARAQAAAERPEANAGAIEQPSPSLVDLEQVEASRQAGYSPDDRPQTPEEHAATVAELERVLGHELSAKSKAQMQESVQPGSAPETIGAAAEQPEAQNQTPEAKEKWVPKETIREFLEGITEFTDELAHRDSNPDQFNGFISDRGLRDLHEGVAALNGRPDEEGITLEDLNRGLVSVRDGLKELGNGPREQAVKDTPESMQKLIRGMTGMKTSMRDLDWEGVELSVEGTTALEQIGQSTQDTLEKLLRRQRALEDYWS